MGCGILDLGLILTRLVFAAVHARCAYPCANGRVRIRSPSFHHTHALVCHLCDFTILRTLSPIHAWYSLCAVLFVAALVITY